MVHEGRRAFRPGFPGRSRRALALEWFIALTILASPACAHLGLPSAPRDRFVIDDSLTTATWHMDDTPTEDHLQDAGRFALHGTAGAGVRTDEGFRGQCRVFNGRSDSFIYVPYSAVLDTMGTIVVSAHVMLGSGAPDDFRTIVARWSPRPELQSWIFFLGGASDQPTTWPPAVEPSRQPGKLYFAIMSDQAPVARVFAATGFGDWREGTWNHVAVVFDGRRVSFYLNGRLDSWFPCLGRIRPSRAPLTIGNIVDISYAADTDVWYRGLDGAGFTGMIDELRISRIGREDSWTPPAGSDR